MQEWTTTTTKETGIDLGDLWLFRWMPRVQTTMTQKAMANKAAQTGLGRNARQILPPAGVYTPIRQKENYYHPPITGDRWTRMTVHETHRKSKHPISD